MHLEIRAFYSLKVIAGENRLDNLWVEPEDVRKGYGQILFKHAVEKAKNLDWDYFRLAGEPDAIVFYEKMGATQIGEIQSRLGEHIFLPHMELVF